MKDKVLVARIVAAHGIKGQVKVKSFCENYADFNSYGDLYFSSGDVVKIKKIGGWKKDVAVCTLEGVNDRNKAEELRGLELFVDSEMLKQVQHDKRESQDDSSGIQNESDENEFFVEDLKGCDVYLDSFQNKRFGEVYDVQDFGAGSLLEILPEGEKNLKKTLLVSFSNDAVLEVNLDDEKILISSEFVVR